MKVRVKSACSEVVLRALKKWWVNCGGADIMLRPSDALANRMMSWSVGGRWSHPLVSWSAFHCTVMTGRKDYSFWSRIETLFRATVIPKWSCCILVKGALSGSRWFEDHHLNQYLTQLSAHRYRGDSAYLGAFIMKSCRKSRTSSQSTAISYLSLRAVAFLYSVLIVVAFSSSESSCPFLPDSLIEASYPQSNILVTKILIFSPLISVYPIQPSRWGMAGGGWRSEILSPTASLIAQGCRRRCEGGRPWSGGGSFVRIRKKSTWCQCIPPS